MVEGPLETLNDQELPKEELSPYYEWISNALMGNTDELANIPKDRLDFAGFNAAMRIYKGLSDELRGDFTQGLGQVIERSFENPNLAADAICLARSLEIGQLETSVRKLEKSIEVGADHPVATEIRRYLRDASSYPPHKP